MYLQWRKLSRGLRSKPLAMMILLTASMFLVLYHRSPTSSNIVPRSNDHRDQRNRRLFNFNRPTTLAFTYRKSKQELVKMPINPYPYNFVMLPAPCTDEDLVIVVHSAVQYLERRVVMRYTWLNRRNLEKELALKIKIVFITGMTNDSRVLERLDYEQQMYGDIVQSDFIDSYQNNTHKAVSYMRWVSSDDGCPRASLMLKVDDDALIHPVKIPKLNKTIHKALNSNQSDIYLGRLLTQEVNRNNYSKWYVSYDLWPHKLYPVWFQGLVYMLTPHLAAKLYPIALHTKYMFTDDVYVGILVSQVKDVHIEIENEIGVHTEGKMDKFRGSFLKEGRMFYHVPSIKHFCEWYHMDGSVISLDPPPPRRRASNVRRPVSRTTKSSSGAGTVLVSFFIFVLMVAIMSLVCCLYGDQ